MSDGPGLLALPVTPVFPAIVHTGETIRSTTYGNVVRQALIDLWTDVQAIEAAGGKVQSVFGRAGVVTAQTGDYTAAQITGAVAGTRKVSAGAGMSGGGTLAADITLNANVISVFGRTGAVVLTQADMSAVGLPADSSTQRVRVSAAGVLAGTRQELNFIQGANVGLAITDNPGANRVDITISAAGGAGGGQTPWITDIDAASHKLNSVGALGIGGLAQPNSALYIVTADSYTSASVTNTSASGFAGFTFTNDQVHSFQMGMAGSQNGVIALRDVALLNAKNTDLVFATANAERLRITASLGNTQFAGHIEIAQNKFYCGNLYHDGSNWRYRAAGSGFVFGAQSATVRVWTAISGSAGAVASVAPVMSWPDTGGTVVNGQIAATGPIISQASGGSGGEFRLNDFDDGGAWSYSGDTARNARWQRYGSGNVTMQLNSATGNVGIGGGAAFRRLSVAGPAYGWDTAGSGGGIFSAGTGVGQTDTCILMGVSDAGWIYGWLQAAKPGTSNYPLLMNAAGGGLVLNVPANTPIADAYLPPNTLTLYVAPGGGSLVLRVRTGGGSILQGSIPLA
jgi:hypothetical protein